MSLLDDLRERISQTEWMNTTIHSLMTNPDDVCWKNKDIAELLLSWLSDICTVFEMQHKCVELWDNRNLDEANHLRSHFHELLQSAAMEMSPIETTDHFEESAYYSLMKTALKTGLEVYLSLHPNPILTKFKSAVCDYLDSFIGGNAKESFCFSVSIRDANSIEYIDFNFEEDILEVTSGGHIHNPIIGGDSYTNWMYTAWSNGEDDGDSINADFSAIFHMLSQVDVAKLSIDFPEELYFCSDAEDEE